MNRSTLAAAALGLLWMSSAVYTVDSREVAVVTQFGQHIGNITAPGLHLKAPWPLHALTRYDARARLLPVEATELLTRDKKNLVVEAFALWRVADPRRFMETVQTDEAAALRLGDLIESQIAAALGQADFTELLSIERTTEQLLPPGVVSEVNTAAQTRFGIAVMEVRLRHVGLPLQNEQSIYERMRAERSRTASRYRSEGEEQATTIRAKSDREASEILAEANRAAAGIRATAEQEAARLYAEAYREDPALYRLLRDLETNAALLDEDATIILSPDSAPFSTLLERR
ncbi:MAG: membrane protease subunit HflC [Myxococcota bacterium]|jgi:membrane protease subunit HflC